MVCVKANVEGGWDLDVDRGPSWLFVRLHPGQGEPTDIAGQIWALADRHFIYRIVLEMDDVAMLPSLLMGQLVMLHKRVLQHGGALRICGLSPDCQQALHFCRLDQALPSFPNRTDAVRGEAYSVHPR